MSAPDDKNVKTEAETKHPDTPVHTVDPLAVFYTTLRQWKWILLSVIICVGLGTLHIMRTPAKYTAATDVLVKPDGPSSNPAREQLANIGLVTSTGTNLCNEITMFTSPDLMEQVVARLGLQQQYFIKKGLKYLPAYGDSLPVAAIVQLDHPQATASFRVALRPEGKIKLTKITTSYGGTRHTATDTETTLSATVKVPGGTITIVPTSTYAPQAEMDLRVTRSTIAAVAKGLARGLTIEPNDNSSGTVLNIQLSGTSGKMITAVLNTLTQCYNEDWMDVRNQMAQATSQSIGERLGLLESELGKVDSDISSFKSNHLVPDIATASQMYLSENESNKQELRSIETQIEVAHLIRTSLQKDAPNSLIPAQSSVSNIEIQGAISAYNSMMLDRNSLVAKSSDKNPLVANLDAQLAAQRTAIISSVDNHLASLETRARALTAASATTKSQLASTPSQAKNLLSYERQQKVKEELYLFLLQKREETVLSQAFSAYNTRVINRASIIDTPPTPNATRILGIALLLGLAIPFGIVYLKEMLNTRIRSRQDLSHLTVPFLGEIPLHPSGRKRMPRLRHMFTNYTGKPGNESNLSFIIRPGSRQVTSEALRVLRTNLDLMRTEHTGADIVAITSFNPGSGKSFITANLGASISLQGKRVLLIDGDMRRASSSAYVGSPERGLTDYLRGTTDDVDHLIVTTEQFPNLSVLPVGKIPPNPAELIETPRFAKLIEDLRDRYDYILIDCPPVELVAEAQIINRWVDRTIFVVRAGLLHREMVPEIEALYSSRRYRNMALVLNGTIVANSRYGNAYSYGGYSYAYGK